MANQKAQVESWLATSGSVCSDEEAEVEESPISIVAPPAATLFDMSTGKIIYPSNLNVCINKEDQVAGKSGVTATLLGGQKTTVTLLGVGGNYEFLCNTNYYR